MTETGMIRVVFRNIDGTNRIRGEEVSIADLPYCHAQDLVSIMQKLQHSREKGDGDHAFFMTREIFDWLVLQDSWAMAKGRNTMLGSGWLHGYDTVSTYAGAPVMLTKSSHEWKEALEAWEGTRGVPMRS
jgi:hypothetical protein